MPLIACQTNTQQKQQTTPITRAACVLSKTQGFTTKTGTTHAPLLVKNDALARVMPLDARVHYPTINHHTHQPHRPAQRGPRKGSHEECDSSKPNSVPNTHPTRTRSEVPHPPPDPHKSKGPPAGSTDITTPDEQAFIDDSTSEQHHHDQPHAGRSMAADSLERR